MAKTVIQSPASGSNGGGSEAGTTFVQADSTCFRDLVQRLTSPSGIQAQAQEPVKSPASKPTQKLHERRKYIKPKIEIGKPAGFQAQQPLQPKIPTSRNMVFAGSPSSSVMMLSPHSSLEGSPINTPLNPREEEKAIKEKRFYLHPSPRSKPRLAAEPELLTLFPLESPTTSSGTNASLHLGQV
ncbi:hypothetical protein PHJA_002925700 [Phtheirospermum japonicum]|uniref:VQ domain-containing protein n=1 Tax=Phtheirospermum japonicum TaxID=374723 RepID=A0A830D7V7_9LAMI|nr:hypothetical protein PHJA_002925700 [Phtheirospermum japonicum]